MGVVAIAAEPFHDGGMNMAFLISPGVALVTEACHVLDGLEVVFAGLFMAE
jgi:hypothetical protein